MAALRKQGVEYRRGASGGGNQLRQPYLRRLLGEPTLATFPTSIMSISMGFTLVIIPAWSGTRFSLFVLC